MTTGPPADGCYSFITWKKYFAFKRQWKDLVSPDLVGKARTEIAYLNKMTPERDILDNFNTMEEAWEYLNTRYGNADKISQELIDEYLKFQFKGKMIIRS